MISVSVIPNENESNIPYHYEESNGNLKHYEILTNFCHHIGLKTTKEEVYNDLLKKGCIVIITMFGDTVATMLPNNISEGQVDKLKELKDFYAKYDYQEFNSWFNNDFHIFPCEEIGNDVLGYFYAELDRKCQSYALV